MTCIAALKHNGVVYMAGDNVVSDTDGLYRRAHGKLFYNGQEILIGCAGSLRVAQIIEHGVSFPGQSSSQEDMTFIVDSIVEQIRAHVIGRGASKKTEEEEHFEAEVMIAYNDNIYVIASDFGVFQPGYPFAAIGSGGKVATGALHVLAQDINEQSTPDDIKKILARALEAAEEHSVGVRRPFDILTLPPEVEE